MTVATPLRTRVRAALREVCDPARAPAMQAYMKSAMPFLGVSAVPMRATCKKLFATCAYSNREEWERDVLALWRGATHREERYAAVELTGLRQARAFHTMAALPMYEEMIVTGAWWDYVDAIAAHRLGLILRNEPRPMKKAMLAWAKGADMWKRRSAMLCQLTFEETTDLELLYSAIAPSLDSKEFFLRKAIGWVLRQYARTDAGEVARYVREHEDRLSPLSKREALKHA